jgi:hypothetical protein
MKKAAFVATRASAALKANSRCQIAIWRLLIPL